MLEQLQDGELRLRVDTGALEQLRVEVIEQSRRGDRIVIGSVLTLGAILWFGLRLEPGWIGVALGAIGFGTWLITCVSSRSRG